MTKYYANMNVNSGSHYRYDMENTNKKKLARQISASARAHCYPGRRYTWKVWNEEGIIVLAGSAIKKQDGNFTYINCKHLVGIRVRDD